VLNGQMRTLIFYLDSESFFTGFLKLRYTCKKGVILDGCELYFQILNLIKIR
jgi:hypothetical protein